MRQRAVDRFRRYELADGWLCRVRLSGTCLKATYVIGVSKNTWRSGTPNELSQGLLKP